jgi:hypothetical protein
MLNQRRLNRNLRRLQIMRQNGEVFVANGKVMATRKFRRLLAKVEPSYKEGNNG